jgi:hypothetical protein
MAIQNTELSSRTWHNAGIVLDHLLLLSQLFNFSGRQHPIRQQ